MCIRDRVLGTPADWLIRAEHNRCLPQGGKLWAATLAEAPLGEIEFTLASRHGQPKRIVRQQLRSHAVDLPARDTDGRHIRVTCLLATEIGAPAGCKPVSYTHLDVYKRQL